MKNSSLRLFLLLCSFGLAVPMVRADERSEVKARIAQRLPSLDRLKASGAIGENLHGFLEVRDGGGDAASVVAAENADREIVYAAIAKQTGSTVEMVSRARARRLAASSAPGVWLQKDDGTWVKK